MDTDYYALLQLPAGEDPGAGVPFLSARRLAKSDPDNEQAYLAAAEVLDDPRRRALYRAERLLRRTRESTTAQLDRDEQVELATLLGHSLGPVPSGMARHMNLSGSYADRFARDFGLEVLFRTIPREQKLTGRVWTWRLVLASILAVLAPATYVVWSLPAWTDVFGDPTNNPVLGGSPMYGEWWTLPLSGPVLLSVAAYGAILGLLLGRTLRRWAINRRAAWTALLLPLTVIALVLLSSWRGLFTGVDVLLFWLPAVLLRLTLPRLPVLLRRPWSRDARVGIAEPDGSPGDYWIPAREVDDLLASFACHRELEDMQRNDTGGTR